MKYTVLAEVRGKAARMEQAKRSLYESMTAFAAFDRTTRDAVCADVVKKTTSLIKLLNEPTPSEKILRAYERTAKSLRDLAADPGASKCDPMSISDEQWDQMLGFLEKLAFDLESRDILRAYVLMEDRLLIEFLDVMLADWQYLAPADREKAFEAFRKWQKKFTDMSSTEKVSLFRQAVEQMIFVYQTLPLQKKPVPMTLQCAEMRQTAASLRRTLEETIESYAEELVAEEKVLKLDVSVRTAREVLVEENAFAAANPGCGNRAGTKKRRSLIAKFDQLLAA